MLLYRQNSTDNDGKNISNTTRTEFDLSGIGYDEEDDDEYNLSLIQQSRSAPASPTKIFDKELAAFIDCDQQERQFIGDDFVYDIDLSETSHSPNSKLGIFFVSLFNV